MIDLVKRPADWEQMTPTQKTRFFQTNTKTKTATRKKYKHLKEKDAPQVHMLLKQLKNHSLVAETLGVGRKTLYRFLEKHPIPDGFEIEDEVTDYEEIKTWLHRQKAFSKMNSIKNYLDSMRKFYAWMLEHYPERARPRLWASDQILEWVQTFPAYVQHQRLTAIRQLANKCPKLFPLIDLGLLPTRKTGKARRSLAGKEEYYLTIDQIRAMIDAVGEIDNFEYTSKVRGKLKTEVITYTELQKKCYQAVIALLFNVACRTGNATTGLGLCGSRIEKLNLKSHRLTITDKYDITWNVLGLSDETCNYLATYLEARGNPTSGFLFTNDNGTPLNARAVNKMLKLVGAKAGITDKRLVCKTFRKSLVKHGLDVLQMNPISLIGTGKNPKTCFCVGWTSMHVLMEHYAPKLTRIIENDRQKMSFQKDWKNKLKAHRLERIKKIVTQHGLSVDDKQLNTFLTLLELSGDIA